MNLLKCISGITSSMRIATQRTRLLKTRIRYHKAKCSLIENIKISLVLMVGVLGPLFIGFACWLAFGYQ